MALIGDVVDSVSGATGDVLGAAGDAMDGAADTLGTGAAWLEGGAEDLWNALADGSVELMDEFLASIQGGMGEILDGVTDGLSEIAAELGEMPALLVEQAIDHLGAVPDRLMDTMERAIEDALGGMLDAVDAIERQMADLCGELTTALEDALADQWDRILSGIESAGQWLETLASVIERVLTWLGRALACVAEALAILGSCLGGVVAYHLVKDSTLAANAYQSVQVFPKRFQKFCADVYPEFNGPQNAWLNWSNTWFIDQANLPQNLFGRTVLGMVLAGVTFKGVVLSHLVFLIDKFRLDQYWRVSNAMHELVHVRQMIRFVHEDVFACAYGAGAAIAGGNMREHPMEVEARKLECRYQAQIQQWTGDDNTKEFAIDPCDMTTEARQPCVGLP